MGKPGAQPAPWKDLTGKFGTLERLDRKIRHCRYNLELPRRPGQDFAAARRVRATSDFADGLRFRLSRKTSIRDDAADVFGTVSVHASDKEPSPCLPPERDPVPGDPALCPPALPTDSTAAPGRRVAEFVSASFVKRCERRRRGLLLPARLFMDSLCSKRRRCEGRFPAGTGESTVAEEAAGECQAETEAGSVAAAPDTALLRGESARESPHCGDKNSRCRSEMNVLAAWQRGYTGKNVVVTILDDGIERNHPDLLQNYDPLASYDVNGNDHDPTPRYDASNENKDADSTNIEAVLPESGAEEKLVVARGGVSAWGSPGIRMLDGDVTDVVEAKSLGIRPDYIDIYSASWGPDDDGKTVDGPGLLAKQAFEHGIKKGRRGLGSIFVWASGNGGREGDYCSCDGYTNSIYTISVSSTTENGYKPWYLEECASTLATTYSSGAFYERKIVTTDLRHRCTDGHTGTSVSAPMVAGIIALALEANPLLTWRDVQHLLVKTSRPVHLRAADWKTNGAGHKVSHLYGFGLVDAEAIVMEAKKWKSVPPQHVCVGSLDRVPKYIRADHVVRATTLTSACADHYDQHVVYLEHVVVRVSISHPRRGDLQISLVSPAGTRSQLLARR
nr:PREDICTED: proprotein convertase subtilisin/kexin type 6-like [Apteryx mantelli mantelli]